METRPTTNHVFLAPKNLASSVNMSVRRRNADRTKGESLWAWCLIFSLTVFSYIQDLKDDLDIMKKTREEQLGDYNEKYEKMKRLVINVEADLDHAIRRIERAEKLIRKHVLKDDELPDLDDDDPARKRARRNHMTDPNDLLLMGIDEQMAIAK